MQIGLRLVGAVVFNFCAPKYRSIFRWEGPQIDSVYLTPLFHSFLLTWLTFAARTKDFGKVPANSRTAEQQNSEQHWQN